MRTFRVVLSAGLLLWALGLAAPAFAAPSALCDDANGGFLNLTGNQSFNSTQPVNPGEIFTATLSGGVTNSLLIFNSTTLFNGQTSGTRSYTVTTNTLAVQVDLQGTGTMSFTCTPAGSGTTSSPSAVATYLGQDAAAAEIALWRDIFRNPYDTMLPPELVQPPPCDPVALRRARAEAERKIAEYDAQSAKIRQKFPEADPRSFDERPGVNYIAAAGRELRGIAYARQVLQDSLDDITRRLTQCENEAYAALQYAGALPQATNSALGAAGLLAGGDSASFYTPLAYATDALPGNAPGAGTLGGWNLFARGSISGLSRAGTTSFAGLNGRVDLGASRGLGNGLAVGGLIGWDSTSVSTASGTVRSGALHVEGMGSYRLDNGMILALSAGGALGGLTSTLGTDSGSTWLQRAFATVSLGGEVWAQGPWHASASGSLGVGGEHQNAFTTTGGLAVPEQTVVLGAVNAAARLGYALPTEIPLELYWTGSAGYTAGGAALGGLGGSAGMGATADLGTMTGDIGASVSVAGPSAGWSLSGGVHGHF